MHIEQTLLQRLPKPRGVRLGIRSERGHGEIHVFRSRVVAAPVAVVDERTVTHEAIAVGGHLAGRQTHVGAPHKAGVLIKLRDV